LGKDLRKERDGGEKDRGDVCYIGPEASAHAAGGEMKKRQRGMGESDRHLGNFVPPVNEDREERR